MKEYHPTMLIHPGDKVLCNDMNQVWSFKGEALVTSLGEIDIQTGHPRSLKPGVYENPAWVHLKIGPSRTEYISVLYVRLTDAAEAKRRLTACQTWHKEHRGESVPRNYLRELLEKASA